MPAGAATDGATSIFSTASAPAAAVHELALLVLAITAVIFVVVVGLYLLGILLSGWLFLEYLAKETWTTFAAALTPEAGNLGMLLYHVQQYGYGPG